MTTRRIWIRRVLAASVTGVAAQQLWQHGHDYVFPERFYTVEPGKIYRGAWQKPWPMKQIVHDYKIKTVLALAHPSSHHLPINERKLLEPMGVKWIHIPIVDNRLPGGPSTEEGIAQLLDQAAAVLADPNNYPIFFHCHHGLNRTSMAQIAYRTKFCGWTLERAASEIERSVGLVKVTHGPDYRYMVTFYETRVLPMRKQQAAAGLEIDRKADARPSTGASTMTASAAPLSPTRH